MNKKGFSLIELLVVIALLGLVIGLGVVGVTNGNKKAREKILATKVNNIEAAAVLYGQDHKNSLVKLADLGLDVNNDGIINAKDVTSFRNFIAGKNFQNVTEPADDEKIYDINQDGIINVSEHTLIRQYVAGGYINQNDENLSINVNDLVEEEYLEADKDGLVINPLNENKALNLCPIIIYRRYGKIYATYSNRDNIIDNSFSSANIETQCWKG